jgi:8-hydroxy-5-deazaflavin:NADPH oxidoreductase
MNIGIIGAGNIGGNLTKRLTGLGHKVSVANSRGAETLTALAAETGAVPADLDRVARGAEIVIVAIPEKGVPMLPKNVLDGMADDAAVIDTGNYYPSRDGKIAAIENGKPESQWVQEQIEHPVVKAFNGVLADALLEKPMPEGSPGRLGVAIASDDSAAKAKVMALVDELGFEPVDAGTIADTWRQQPGTPWYGKGLDADGVRRALAEASPERPKEFRAA